MSDILIRQATELDAPAMAELRERSAWQGAATADRMRLYLRGEHHPQHAQATRTAFAATDDKQFVAFIAGHLTTRFACDGELQWLLVAPEARGGRTATLLWTHLQDWFVSQGARRVCVNVEPDNLRARRFYARMGAIEMSPYWMVWTDVAERCTPGRS
jgi:ribosomal protein S18 acetylase RimI-like enzyme